MIPIIEEEVVKKRRWIDEELFTDLIAVAQTCQESSRQISVFLSVISYGRQRVRW